MRGDLFHDGKRVWVALDRLNPDLEPAYGFIRGVSSTEQTYIGLTYIVEIDVPGYEYSCISVASMFLSEFGPA